jgi:amidase
MGEELASLDAVAQAQLVRRGEVSPLELCDAAIARIERWNPTLNAVVAPLFDEARAAAASPALPDGPFRGVPFLLKDVGAMQAGQPYWAGNRALREADYRAPRDCALGRRFRAAGLVTLGKTNTPEFGLQSTTQPLAFGPTHNPWDLERSSGGSSGGSAAAVAAGLVPIAHANDGGGSIRIPAAWCGLVGLKPSRGRVSRGVPGARTCVEFAVTRSVRDAAALLDAIATATALPRPAGTWFAEAGADPGSLRVGFLAGAPKLPLHPACADATASVARLLEELGHRVELASPACLFDEQRAWRGLAIWTVEYKLCLRELERMLRRPIDEDDVEPFLWSIAHLDEPPLRAEEYVECERWLRGWAARVRAWWRGFDLLLTPTVIEPAVPLDSLWPPPLRPWELVDRMAPHMALVEPWNATGQPAISLPLGWSADGLPVGVQLVAAPGRDDVLLRVAAQLEQAKPWAHRRPPISA